MDPSRIVKPSDAEDSSPSSRASFTRAMVSSMHGLKLDDKCSYWVTMQRKCVKEDCHDVQQLFRQCAKRPIEQALVPEPTRDSDWAPAPPEAVFKHHLTHPSFAKLGRATDELVRDMSPELQRMQHRMGELSKDFDQHPLRTIGSLISHLGDITGEDGKPPATGVARSSKAGADDPLAQIRHSLAKWSSTVSRDSDDTDQSDDDRD